MRSMIGKMLSILLFACGLWGTSSFKLGVASGDAGPDRVYLWTYYSGANSLKVCAWTEDRQGIWSDAPVRDGGYVQVEVSGLKPGTRYRYAFSEIDSGRQVIGQSPVGYFRTALPENTLETVRFGAVSCIKYLYEPVLLEQAAREKLDLFLFNGDNSYNDGMVTQQEFRERWQETISKKGHLELRGAFGMIATIDDHDIENNFDREQIDPVKFNNGLAAFFEHMPMRRNPEEPGRVWRKLSWGQTLDIFVLDCRTERHPSQGQYISLAQMSWLKQELLASKAMFKVIMNSVPITEYPSWFVMAHDRWQGFPEQRKEILEFIDDHEIKNLLWLSGDFHFTSQQRVSSEGPGSSQIEVLAGPGAQISNRAWHPLKLYKQFDWVHVKNSYLVVECNVERGEILVEPKFLD